MIATLEQFVKRQHLLFSALAGLLIALAVLAASFQGIIYSERSHLESSGSLFQNNVRAANGSRDAVFDFVRSLEKAPCTIETLNALRSQLYVHYMVRDIVVFDPDSPTIICSAVAGLLAEPFEVAGPPRRNREFPDRMAWNEPDLVFLPGDERHHLVREGAFGVVLDSEILKETFARFDWQLYVRNAENEFAHHVFGNKDLHRDFARSLSSPVFARKVVERVCVTPEHYLCILLARDTLDVIWQNRLIMGSSMILALVLGVLGFAGSERAIAGLGSPEDRIRKAMKKPANTNFHCHYQPVIDLQTGRIVGCEVLARYDDQLGPIPPYIFIPLIEATGQTWKFTELIMNKVVEDFRMLQELPTDFRIAINVFPADLDTGNLDKVRDSEALRDLLGVGTQTVCEILETSVTDRKNSAETLEFLNTAGVEIAIDDFGTGFSNLEQLKAVDTDYLKIDKSFVDELSTSDGSVVGAFVRHIVSLASEMDIKVVAEGVEEKEQISMLKDLGVQYGQGFYFSRPVSLSEFSALLDRNFHDPGEASGANRTEISATG